MINYLQNIHLVKKWLPSLEKKLEHFSEGSHPNYRVFMSAEPAATPSAHIIPQVSRNLFSTFSFPCYCLFYSFKIIIVLIILFTFHYLLKIFLCNFIDK